MDFDIVSVMMYGWKDFSKNGERTTSPSENICYPKEQENIRRLTNQTIAELLKFYQCEGK